MKHIPTLTIIFNKQTDLYGYSYDAEDGTTQVSDGYVSVSDALGSAFKKLKSFLVLEDVETYE